MKILNTFILFSSPTCRLLVLTRHRTKSFSELTWALLSLRYHILVSKYGQLAPLAEVDLSPRCTVVDVRWGERVEAVSLSLEQTVVDLKKHLRAVLQLPTNGIRLFYINREMCSVFGPEELKCGSRALHSYSIRDGDEILVVPKVKSSCSQGPLCF